MNKRLTTLIILGMISVLSLAGCATDNPFLLQCKFINRRSDQIPGLTQPWKRAELIREKAKNASKAPAAERDLIVTQLIKEFRESSNPNIRRETIDAIAVIPHPYRIDYLKEGLFDEDPGVRMAACNGIAEGKENLKNNSDEVGHILRTLLASEKDTDVRTNAIRLIGTLPCNFTPDQLRKGRRPGEDPNLIVLGQALNDRSTVVQYQAMLSLKQYTRLDYGVDQTRWTDFVAYVNGESNSKLPAERSLAEKLPTPQLRMFR